MKETGITVGEVPTVQFPDKTKKDPTGDEKEKRFDRYNFRDEVLKKYLEGGKLPRGARLISSNARKPEKSY